MGDIRLNPYTNQSVFAQPVRMDNFTPDTSASLAVSNSGGTGSASITFPDVTGTFRNSYKITNTGTKGAFIGWGSGSAIAVVATSTPAANCDYVAAGAIYTQDFQSEDGPVDTIAAICAGSDTTTLQITYGSGQ